MELFEIFLWSVFIGFWLHIAGALGDISLRIQLVSILFFLQCLLFLPCNHDPKPNLIIYSKGAYLDQVYGSVVPTTGSETSLVLLYK